MTCVVAAGLNPRTFEGIKVLVDGTLRSVAGGSVRVVGSLSLVMAGNSGLVDLRARTTFAASGSDSFGDNCRFRLQDQARLNCTAGCDFACATVPLCWDVEIDTGAQAFLSNGGGGHWGVRSVWLVHRAVLRGDIHLHRNTTLAVAFGDDADQARH